MSKAKTVAPAPAPVAELSPAVNHSSLGPYAVAKRNGICRSTVYQEINAGRLVAHKMGKRTIIFPEDEAAWRRNLPILRPRQVGAVGRPRKLISGEGIAA